MGRKDFSRKECIRALLKLGFEKDNKRRGNHDKFKAPADMLKYKHAHQPPFIMVPRSRRLHCQLEILKELWALGGEDLIDKFMALIK